MPQKEKINQPKSFTVSRTETIAYVFEVTAKTEEEALKKAKTVCKKTSKYNVTTDIFYQIET